MSAAEGPSSCSELAAARRALAERPDDPEAIERLADALRRSVVCPTCSRTSPLGEPALAEAVALRQRLADLEPADLGRRDDLAEDLCALAEALCDGGQPAEAERAAAEAVEILRARAAGDPTDAAVRDLLADAWTTWGRVAAKAGDRAAALNRLETAIALRRELVGADLGYADPQECLAMTCEELGELHRDAGEHAAAVAAFREAIAAWEGVRPRTSDASRGLRFAWRETAARLAALGDLAGACAAYESSLGAGMLIPLDDRAAEDAADRCSILDALAEARAARRDAAGAERALRDAVATARTRFGVASDADACAALGFALRRLGDHLAAAGRHPESVAVFGDCVAVRRAERKLQPENQDTLIAFSLACSLLRDAHAACGDRSAALDAAREAADASRRLAALPGVDPGVVREAAVDLYELGRLLHEAGDLDGADTAFAESESLFRRLLAADASLGRARHDLSLCLRYRADVRLARHDSDAAEALVAESVALLRALRDEDAAEPLRRTQLAAALRDAAHVREIRGDAPGALAALEEASELVVGARGVVADLDEEIRETLSEAADAAAAAGRPDRAVELRSLLDRLVPDPPGA